jgi:hypothetical protein
VIRLLLYKNLSLSFLINKPVYKIENQIKLIKDKKEKDLRNYSSILKIMKKNDNLTFLQRENLKFLNIEVFNKINEIEGDIVFTIEEINSNRAELEKWMSYDRINIINKFIEEVEGYIEQLNSIQNRIINLLSKKIA